MNYRKAKADLLTEMQSQMVCLRQRFNALNALDEVYSSDCGYDLYDQLTTTLESLESLESVLGRMQELNGGTE